MLIDDFLLVDAGRFREAEIVALLAGAKYPSRNPAQNIADLKAQIAASEKGVRGAASHGAAFRARTRSRPICATSRTMPRRRCAACCDKLKDGEFSYEMDDGARGPCANLDRPQGAAARPSISPAPAPSCPINFNAPTAVCKAAVLYVFRTLVEDEIPMNGGCLKPLDIVIPEGSMLSPRYPAAVVAGNVETSQCITDALYGALGRDGRRAGDDEQLHLRQCALPVLRDDLRRLGRRARFRRHGRRPHAYDQHPPHRSRSARMALSGAARTLRHQARLGRAGANGTAATARCGGSSSARP